MKKRSPPKPARKAAPAAPPDRVGAGLRDALAHHQAGRFAQAEAGYRAALALDRENADALHLLGVLALQSGKPAQAVDLILRAVHRAPDAADFHDNLGSAFAALGRHAEAAEAHANAVRLGPGSAAARFNLGNALQALGRTGEAAAAFRDALALRPDYAKASYNLGNAMRAAARTADAAAAFAHAAALAPGMAEAHNNLGDALAALGRLDEAIAQHRIVVRQRHGDATALYNLGAALQQRGRYEEAELVYRDAIRHQPNHVGALNNLGSVLRRLGRPDQSAPCHRLALVFRPDFIEALYNLGNAVQRLGRMEEAQRLYERVLERNPTLATASHNLALLALMKGDLRRGWHGYEQRFAAREARPDRHIAAPRWDGRPLAGGRLLIWREQGVGDEILFACCYGEAIARAGGNVVIEADRRLVSLFARSFPEATVRAESCVDDRETIDPPDCDAQTPAGSLPRLLRPDLASFAGKAPWLIPDPALTERWRSRLSALGPGPRIGISWKSQLVNEERRDAYTTLDQWGPLLTLPGVRIVNAQYGDVEEEIAAAERRFGVRIHRWRDLNLKDDFDGAAALTANLDLVVTVATSAGELAGALGVPTWRFGGSGDWSSLGAAVRPWYPAMRVFMTRPGEQLANVLARIAAELRRDLPAASPIDPRRGEERLTDGLALHRQGRLAEAAQAYAEALDADPAQADAAHLWGLVAHQQGDAETALARIGQALAIDPGFPQAINNRGLILQATGRTRDAEDDFRRAATLEPAFAEALSHLGLALQSRRQHAPAERWHRRALALRPDNAGFLTNLGAALELSGRFREAEAAYRRSTAIEPCLPDGLNNLGTIARLMGRPANARGWFERAIRVAPEHALAGWNHGLLALADGDLARGWAGFQQRFRAAPLQKPRRIPLPVWDGGPLGGRRLLVWGEMGVGDEILFASCFDALERAGGPVVVECEAKLAPLLARAFPWATVRPATGHPNGPESIVPPDCDLQIPAGSLPALFRRRLSDFSGRRSFLAAEPTLAALWRDRVAALPAGLRVGIGWRSQIVDPHRKPAYTTLDQWGPALGVAGLVAVNLQYDDCAAEIAAAEARFGVAIHRWPDLDLKDDLESSAALIANLDLVITPALATGELAGALGVPVWRFGGPDWTWLGAGARPWFPSMSLLQPRAGETLTNVLGRIAGELARLRG